MSGLGGKLGLARFQGSVINPFKSTIIGWLNLLTDTSDTEYDGITPTTAQIEAYADTINGEII